MDVYVDYNSPVLPAQYATLEDLSDFGKEIAGCRTFVFVREIEPLLSQNLIKGGDLENAIVIYDKEMPQDELNKLADLMKHPRVKVDELGIISGDLKFKNEPARHKLLDIIGDLALAGKQIHGKVIARFPGHKVNTEVAKLIRKEIKGQEVQSPLYDDTVPPLLDSNAIRKMLPHRWPFLMVDKILEIRERSIIGVKNISSNETVFMGHFPDEPVMPGVLVLEAMGQVGAILIKLQPEFQDNTRRLVYLTSIERAKFRRPVKPGDQLRTVARLVKRRGNVGRFSFVATVDGETSVEGIMGFTILSGLTLNKSEED